MKTSERYNKYQCVIVTHTSNAVLLAIKDRCQLWVPQSVLHGGDWLWLERTPDCIGEEREMRLASWFCRKKGLSLL